MQNDSCQKAQPDELTEAEKAMLRQQSQEATAFFRSVRKGRAGPVAMPADEKTATE